MALRECVAQKNVGGGGGRGIILFPSLPSLSTSEALLLICSPFVGEDTGLLIVMLLLVNLTKLLSASGVSSPENKANLVFNYRP